MKPDFAELDRRVAQARVLLSLTALTILYVDPSLGGLFHLDRWLLLALIAHLLCSAGIYLLGTRWTAGSSAFRRYCTSGFDLLFATLIAMLTEGRTSPSIMFFVFAIVAVGFRSGLLDTVTVTLGGVLLYAAVELFSGGALSVSLMRAVYLAIAGYLIGFFGQQRIRFESRLRELEMDAERQTIARALHDGYLQALAAISLRLESCRDMLFNDEPQEALSEIREIQMTLTREYDEVREYVRSLAERHPDGPGSANSDASFHVQVMFAAPGTIVEHILQIALEGIRNTRRHGHARSGIIDVRQATDSITITIDDDGIGFEPSAGPPWTIASRVAECGGRLTLNHGAGGAHLMISLPWRTGSIQA